MTHPTQPRRAAVLRPLGGLLAAVLLLAACAGATGPSGGYGGSGNLSDSWGWDTRPTSSSYLAGQYDGWGSGRGQYGSSRGLEGGRGGGAVEQVVVRQ